MTRILGLKNGGVTNKAEGLKKKKKREHLPISDLRLSAHLGNECNVF